MIIINSNSEQLPRQGSLFPLALKKPQVFVQRDQTDKVKVLLKTREPTTLSFALYSPGGSSAP